MLSHHRHPRRERSDGERGFTLTELLIVLLILAAIITPLAGAFVTSIKATRSVDTTLTNSFDSQLLANYFTTDVQSAEGPHNPEVYEALTATPPTTPDLTNGVCGSITDTGTQFPILTLAWNTTLQGRPSSTLAERVSYVVEGKGTESKLIRRYCVGTDVFQYVVAQGFGVDGQEGLDLVRGPNPADPFNSLCTAYACTIVVAGTANYTLTVERRVPGPDVSVALLVPNPPASVTAEGLNESASVTWPASILTSGQGTVLGYQVLAYADDPGNPAICQNSVLPDGVGPAVTAQSVGSTTLQQYVGGLTNGAAYCFRVRARNAAGWGIPSPPSNIVVPAPSPPPPPLNLTAYPSDKAVRLTWTANPNTGGYALIGYQVNISPVPAGVSVPVTIDPTVTEITFGCPDACLINGTTYTFSIAGFNSRGTGPAASVTGRPYGPADPPVNVTTRAGGIGDPATASSNYYKGGMARATWNALSGAALQGGTLWGYQVAAFPPGDLSPTVTNLAAGTGTSGVVGCTNSSLPCLVNGRNYNIRVAAVTSTVAGVNCETTPASCTIGKYSANAISSAPAGRETIVPSGPPGPPTNVQVTYVQDRDWLTANVNTSWADVYTLNPNLTPPQPEQAAWNGAVPIKYRTEYRLDWDRDIDTGEQPPGAWGAKVNLTTLQQTDVYGWTNIEGGAWYQFRVVAINRGEWFQATDLDREGAASDFNDTQVLGTQGFPNAFYAVAKPDVPPNVNPSLIRQPNYLGQGCFTVNRQGYSGSYYWDAVPAPADPNNGAADYWNGVKWDYRHVVFRFTIYDRTTGADLSASQGKPTWAERTTLATGARQFCSNAFLGNRRVAVQVAYGGYDAPSESLYNNAYTLNGMIQGNYSSFSAQVDTN